MQTSNTSTRSRNTRAAGTGTRTRRAGASAGAEGARTRAGGARARTGTGARAGAGTAAGPRPGGRPGTRAAAAAARAAAEERQPDVPAVAEVEVPVAEVPQVEPVAIVEPVVEVAEEANEAVVAAGGGGAGGNEADAEEDDADLFGNDAGGANGVAIGADARARMEDVAPDRERRDGPRRDGHMRNLPAGVPMGRPNAIRRFDGPPPPFRRFNIPPPPMMDRRMGANMEYNMDLDEPVSPEEAFENCLKDVLKLTDQQIDTLVDDGYTCINEILYWDYEGIAKYVSAKQKQHLDRGGCNFSRHNQNKLQALAWWATDRHQRGYDIDVERFDDETLRDYIAEARNEYEEKELAKNNQPTKPDKFKHNCWITWEEAIFNYLGQLVNARGIPLSYVIYQKGTNQYGVTRPEEKEKVYNAKVEGNIFSRDTQKVLKLLQELTLDTPAADWIKGIECGRAAMEALQRHFDGESEGDRRKTQARAEIETLYYRNEHSFSFERYATKLKNCFDILERYKVPMHEEEKVNTLLNRIQTSSQDLKTEISICRNSHNKSFIEAVTFMQTGISRLFPHNQSRNRRRQINAYGRGDRGGRFGGRNSSRGRGRGGRNGYRRDNNDNRGYKRKNDDKYENGVDISDRTRFFNDDEWRKLSYQTRDLIHNDPDRIKRLNERNSRRRGASAATTVTDHQSDRNSNSSRSGPPNGSRAVSGAKTSGSVTSGSEITYDQYGNSK